MQTNRELKILETCITLPTPLCLFAVGIFKRVAEMHNAARIVAVRQPPGVAQFMNRFLHGAVVKCFFVSPHAEPEQRNYRGFCVRVGQAEDEIQAVRVEVMVSDAQNSVKCPLVCRLEKKLGSVLLSHPVECGGWNFSLDGNSYLHSLFRKRTHKKFKILLFHRPTRNQQDTAGKFLLADSAMISRSHTASCAAMFGKPSTIALEGLAHAPGSQPSTSSQDCKWKRVMPRTLAQCPLSG